MDEKTRKNALAFWADGYKPTPQPVPATAELLHIARKRFWTLLIPLTLIGMTALYLAFSLLIRTELAKLDSRTSAAIEITRGNTVHNFETVYGDLQYIASSDLTRQLLLNRNRSDYRQQTERKFQNMIKTHRIYDQIRLLSETGQELVRINYNQGNPVIVPQQRLQDKSNRYYFIDTANISDDRIYVSQMDLNMEKGQIERPYKPMIRFAKPVRNPQGALIGVVVLNYFGSRLLNSFRLHMDELPSQSMLLNPQGYWLSSDRPEQEWGFMFNNNKTFANSHQDVWQQVKQQEQGIVETDQGRFSFASLRPLPAERLASTTYSLSLKDWKIVVINKHIGFNMDYLNRHLTYIYPLLFAYPIMLILLWLWAKAAAGRQIAEGDLHALNLSLEDKVYQRTAELEATKHVTILSLATLAETRDNETGLHIRRTQRYIRLLANALKQHPDFQQQLDGESIELIFKSAPLHDIGKVGIPDAILLKSARLTAEEFDIMKQHTVHGSDAIDEAIDSLAKTLAIDSSGTFLNYSRDIARYHHERWDGSGYPDGLSGEAIPLSARLMALADVYDALVSQRVYKKAFSQAMAEEIILQQSPGQFDPRIVEAFKQIKQQFWQIRMRYAEFGEVISPVLTADPTDAPVAETPPKPSQHTA